jgi:hypothetical protein
MYNDNPEYARSRLEGTVIRTGLGEPVYVSSVEPSDTGVSCNTIRLKDSYIESFPLDNLDLTPVPLGYLNKGTNALWVFRKPIRASKQGLSMNNCNIQTISREWPLKELHKTILGEYDPLSVLLPKISKGSLNTVGFDRHFAMGLTTLLYKGKEAGTVANGKFSLNRRYWYLTEYLEEVLEKQGMRL